MKLSTGKIAFPIEFDNGDKDCIYFNPTDPNLPIRMLSFQERLSERVKELENIKLNEEETDGSSVVAEYKKFQDILCNELDIAFGSEVSAVIFKHCSPFAVVNGEYFILQFVNAIKPEIEKHIKQAKAEVEKKMAKHLDKYIK